MIEFKRYPHVVSIIGYYSKEMGEKKIESLMKFGVKNEFEAEFLSRFIWKMIDQMAHDIENKKPVLGCVDNSDIIPDIDYEISLYLSEQGYEDVWDRVCDEN